MKSLANRLGVVLPLSAGLICFVVACSRRDSSVSPPPSATSSPAPALAPTAIIPNGTRLAVRLLSAVGSASSRAEQPVRGELAEPVRVGDVEVLPAATPLFGVVAGVQPSGKVRGRGTVTIRFDTIRGSDDAHAVTLFYTRTAEPTKKRDAVTVAVPAAGGALVGAMLGGKKGAAVGGLIGAGAGAGIVMSTAGDDVVVPAGAVLHLTLDRDLVVHIGKS